jgi:hypothetical protein
MANLVLTFLYKKQGCNVLSLLLALQHIFKVPYNFQQYETEF